MGVAPVTFTSGTLRAASIGAGSATFRTDTSCVAVTVAASSLLVCDARPTWTQHVTRRSQHGRVSDEGRASHREVVLLLRERENPRGAPRRLRSAPRGDQRRGGAGGRHPLTP